MTLPPIRPLSGFRVVLPSSPLGRVRTALTLSISPPSPARPGTPRSTRASSIPPRRRARSPISMARKASCAIAVTPLRMSRPTPPISKSRGCSSMANSPPHRSYQPSRSACGATPCCTKTCDASSMPCPITRTRCRCCQAQSRPCRPSTKTRSACTTRNRSSSRPSAY